MEHRQDVKPTFQFFAQWIKDRAKISRLNRDTSAPRQGQTHTETSSIKSLTNPSSNFNSKRPLQPLKPVQRPSSRGSQRSNPGDREYRDVVKQIHNQTPKYSNHKFQKNSPGETSPLHRPQHRDQSSPSMNLECAWCTDNGKSHNHATPDLSLIHI